MAKQALNNQVATAQEDGTAYEGLGLISQLMLVSLDTATLPIRVDVSAPIQQLEVSVSLGFSALKDHESQYRAREVRKHIHI